MRSKVETITKRSFKTFDEDSFQADLSTVPFSVSYVFDNPDDVYFTDPGIFFYNDTSEEQ